MITHNQMVYAIRELYPAIESSDHGRTYWVGMPVDGDTQLGPAYIMEWRFSDIPKPDTESILAKWEEVKAGYFQEDAENKVRWHRSTLLTEADIIVYRAMDSDNQEALLQARVYRQALRDITLQDGFPHSVVWPTKPAI